MVQAQESPELTLPLPSVVTAPKIVAEDTRLSELK